MSNRSMRLVRTALPCGKCGYSLRGLPRDGLCPECGESIVATIESARRGPPPMPAWLVIAHLAYVLCLLLLILGFVAEVAPPLRPKWNLFMAADGCIVVAGGVFLARAGRPYHRQCLLRTVGIVIFCIVLAVLLLGIL